MEVRGCSVLVTGAGSGLGRASARLLSESGARLVLLDMNAESLKNLRKEIPNAQTAVADVCDPIQVEAALDIAVQAFGGIRAAISCAGIPGSAKLLSRGIPHELELWRRVIDVNLTGAFNVMRLAAARMSRNEPDPITGERGVIVNTASVAAFDGQRGQVAYAAAKAGIVGMSLPVARDLAGQGIRCVAIAPGLFDTELFQHIPQRGIEALQQSLLFPKRMGAPAEFALFVQHVIENSYLNGSCHRIDGGARLKDT